MNDRFRDVSYAYFDLQNDDPNTEDRATAVSSLLAPAIALTLCSWRRGVVVSGVRRMNEVNARRARLVPGQVTVFGRVYYLGM